MYVKHSIRVCGKDIQIQGRWVRIARLAGDGYDFLPGHPSPTLSDLRQYRPRIDLFTFLQRVSETAPQYEYPLEWDNAAVLQVSTFDTWWATQIDFRVRNKVRKAEKSGVSVRSVAFDDALVKGIWEIYNECPIRQGRRFWHYGKDVDAVRRENATFLDRSVFLGAFLGSTLIGVAKLVSDDLQSQAGLMQILSMIHHRDKAPTNALIAQAVRVCAERGIPSLVYSKFTYGKKCGDSLSQFKVANGFRRVDVPRYYVPLTRVGRLALGAGLHQRLAERVPEAILDPLRRFRRRWLTRGLAIANDRP